jgi:hypothetical protein
MSMAQATPQAPKPAPTGNAAPAAAKPTQSAPAATGKKKRVSKVDPNETQEQKVKRLGTARVNKAVKAIRQIGNLAAYKPTPEQVTKIVNTLGSAANEVAARLRGVTKSEDSFSL